MSSSSAPRNYWLLKAEPDTRIEKGKDVKFSVDDFESVKTSPWEGVRNYEARNLMKEMKVGEKALFYHSNCKNPGIAAFAQVSKEAYPDYTAWDASHPYFDAKSDSENPKWFMVDLTFVSRAKNFIPLSLLRYMAETSYANLPEVLQYLKEEDLQAIKDMDLVTRGRLSVQRVKENAWKALSLMAETGGWDELDLKPKKGGKAKPKAASAKVEAVDEEEERPKKRARKAAAPKPAKSANKRRSKKEVEEDDGESSLTELDESEVDEKVISKKRKQAPAQSATSNQEAPPTQRRSSRNKKP